MKQVTFSDVRIAYPRCTLIYDVQGTKVTKYLNVANLPEAEFRAADQSVVKYLVAHVGMAYVPQLFGLVDFDVVNVRPLWLSPDGVEFYETFFLHGLAELRLATGLISASVSR